MKSADKESYPFWLKLCEHLFAPLRRRGYSIKCDCTPKFDTLESVDYGKLRHRIQNGDLLFCGGDYAFSKVIRYFSGRSRVSHVGIVYWWSGRLMVLESVEIDGVRTIPVSHYVLNYENSGKPYAGRLYLARDRRLGNPTQDEPGAASNPQVDELLGQAATLLNKKFSLMDVLIFFWQGNTGRERHEDNDHFLCSEFVAKCFECIGIIYPHDGRGFVAPEHIAMSDDVDALVEIRTGQ